MDINNTNSISSINLNTRNHNFEPTKKPIKQELPKEDFKQEDINLIDKKSSRLKVNVDEIQKYASMVGENLSVDDINYGLMYGRSVIADYSA